MKTIITKRLKLRDWREDDLEPLAAMNADPRVMEYFFGLADRQQTQAMFDRLCEQHREHGFGCQVVEIPGVAEFAGFVGLGFPRFETGFTPCIEIAWRLAFEFWGQGYATEGAGAIIQYGFQELKLEEIVAMTVEQNLRSRRVMDKLGMQYCPDGDFIHPLAPPGHPCARHVLYRIRP